ncbi:MAG: hypothetical protein GWO07_02000 [Candidatus Dadabacteria bacterium]|nr:hypothetical protein [Candidatus Dadabacteria bacterium]NIS07542.1 hypothetical protein [Candidatus Dadabacteria bacterium]NIY22909.1 hypothetical protein [Candidatus Dadabacteria bacterium]
MKMFKLRKLSLFAIVLLAVALLLPLTDAEAQQRKRKKETAKTALVITDYEWRSGGRGREGILNSLTIENVGKNDYENISIEVEFISNIDVPQGSLRTTIKDNLISGSTKTFTNISLGIMNTDFEKSIIRITGAKLVEIGIDSPKDVIFVKDWQWLETNYGTEGILKFITLENKSDTNYKKIQISIDFQSAGDSRAVPFRTVIHDYLPANSEKTFNNINVGFKYRGARDAVINVRDAQKITKREYRSILAKEGVRIDENTPGIDSYPEYDSQIDKDRNLSLAERYRKYVLKIDPESGEQTIEGIEQTETELEKETLIEEPKDSYAYYRDQAKYPKRVDNAITDEQLLREQANIFPEVFKELVIVSAEADPVTRPAGKTQNYQRHKIEYRYEEPKEEKGFIGRAVSWSKGLVGLGDDEEGYELVETEVAVNQNRASSSGIHPYTSVARVDGKNIEYENITEDEYLLETDEDYEPLPTIDIEIRGYKVKPGIVSTIGQLQEITLVNRSNITYTNIQLEVTFYSRGATKQLGSNKFVINEILPKRTRRTFRNVDIGFLNTVPEELKIRIVDAIDIN